MNQSLEKTETEAVPFEIEEIHIKNEPIDALSENEQEIEEAYNQMDQSMDPFNFLRVQISDWTNYVDESGVTDNGLVPITGKRKTHTCHICLKEYVDLKSIRRHLLRIHNIEPPAGTALYECPDCFEKFSDKSHLDRHTLKHSGLKPHICQKCNKGFSRKEHLTRHTLNVNCENNKVKKEKEEKIENTKSSKKKKMNLSENQTPKTSSINGTELLAVLKVENVPTNFPQCNICEKKFVHQTHLRVHMKTHDNVPTKFECPICGKNLTRKTHLNHHIKRLHGKKEPEYFPENSIRGSFPCTLCPKILTDSIAYDKHMSMHSNSQIKKEVCDICSHVFLSKWHVKKHKLHKHNIEPDNGCLACVYCQKKFIDNYYLKRHYMTKHKNEPYPHENPFDLITKVEENKEDPNETTQYKQEIIEETENVEEGYLEDVEEEVY